MKVKWKLSINPELWTSLSEEQKVETLSCVSENINVFGDFEGEVSFEESK